MLNKILVSLISVLIMFTSQSCNSPETLNEYSPSDERVFSSGRIDRGDPDKLRLYSPGAYIAFRFKGSEFSVDLRNNFPDENHNYVSIEVDDEYKGKFKVEYEKENLKPKLKLENGVHDVVICKATESISGYLEIGSIYCDSLLENEISYSRRIEFIGNSITCGAEADTSAMGCDDGVYHDNMNAYMAYGPRVSRELNADYVLSSVSGLGVIRFWNAEIPNLPLVYESLFLTEDKSELWEASDYNPDLVSICLGQNDFSEGDGSYDRQPLDSTTFVDAYLMFIQRIHDRYPNAKISILNSPMLGPELSTKFDTWLEQIISLLNTQYEQDVLSYYTFTKQYANGCTGHPNLEDHKDIAEELMPFYRSIMNWE